MSSHAHSEKADAVGPHEVPRPVFPLTVHFPCTVTVQAWAIASASAHVNGEGNHSAKQVMVACRWNKRRRAP